MSTEKKEVKKEKKATVATPKTPKATAPKAPKEKKVKEATAAVGRPSPMAGKKITKIAEGNPYREGSARHESFKLIRNGMSFEKFIEAGGSSFDLKMGVERGFLSVE